MGDSGAPSSKQQVVPTQGMEGMGRHRQAQIDRWMGCSACHPRDGGMGPRDESHGTSARTTLESQIQMACSPLGQHSFHGDTRVPLPLHPFAQCTLQVHFLHWGTSMDAGGKGGEGQPSLALPVQCPTSTYHPTSPSLMPFKFPETPQDHCHMCHGIPSRSCGRIGHLPRVGAEGTPQSLAHAGPSPTHPVMFPNRSRAQHPPAGQQDTLVPQTGRKGSAGCGGKQQRDARGRRERLEQECEETALACSVRSRLTRPYLKCFAYLRSSD